MASPVFVGLPKRMVAATIDGRDVQMPEGATILDACRSLEIDTPTLCYLETLTPVNVCRGCDAHISTEFDTPLPDSACVYCGNCIGVCPTGALMFKSEHDMRGAGTWDESKQHVTETVCPYCGVGCVLELHVQDNSIVKVTSPLDHSVTAGHLCVKGRFGFEFVQKRKQ